jgi:hypothetical protein
MKPRFLDPQARQMSLQNGKPRVSSRRRSLDMKYEPVGSLNLVTSNTRVLDVRRRAPSAF